MNEAGFINIIFNLKFKKNRMTEITPPNIWRYDECAAVNTDSVNMKEYKPVGQFYTDLAML
jgi:hypothetical protein